jgi:hypothetical protein
MTSRIDLSKAEAKLRARMAASRLDLTGARNAIRLQDGKQYLFVGNSNGARGRAGADRTNVTLHVAIVVGSLIVGPRRVANVVVRNGLLAWISKNVRRTRAGASHFTFATTVR